jgi:hypothetical protein
LMTWNFVSVLPRLYAFLFNVFFVVHTIILSIYVEAYYFLNDSIYWLLLFIWIDVSCNNELFFIISWSFWVLSNQFSIHICEV